MRSMEHNKKRFIRDGLRGSGDFREDLARFLNVDPAHFLSVKEAAEANTAGTLVLDRLDAFAEQVGQKPNEAQATAFMFYFLSMKLSDGASPYDLVDEACEVASVALEPAVRAALAEALAPSAEAVQEEKSREAFNFGNTLGSMELKTVIAFNPEDEPVPGASWTIGYIDGAGRPKSLSLNASAGELRASAARMIAAAEKAEADCSRLGS